MKREFLICVLIVISLGFVVGAPAVLSEPSSCCERTVDGAWCLNADEAECDASYQVAPTSCETTSYCRLGTCYDSEEGICMENTPARVCNDNGGTWDVRGVEEVPQCQLGCCIIADQAAFVPLVRCKRLSTLFGVESDYRTNIGDEVSCIAEAQSQDVGACVYEKDFERVCEFTTRGDCGAAEVVETINSEEEGVVSSGRTFYKDFLCSAEELNTVCARQAGTTCYRGDVYWVDSCGNRENVYSGDEDRSWANGRVIGEDDVCSPNDGSDADCGNCDYLLGSRCGDLEGRWLGGGGKVANYCQRTECVDRNGDVRVNGESWCVGSGASQDGRGQMVGGSGLDYVGSRYYREICIDGDVHVEPCADFRNEVCLEGSIETSAGEFGTAGCRVNRWQDCVFQLDEEDCVNVDKRDCVWLPSVTGLNIGGGEQGVGGRATGFSNPTSSGAFSNPTGNVITGYATEEGEEESVSNRGGGVCVPAFSPGLNFWEGGQSNCGLASARCIVVREEDIFGGHDKIVEGKECLDESWALGANRVCSALGDCGGYVNYVGEYTDDGYSWIEDGRVREFSPNVVNKIKSGF